MTTPADTQARNTKHGQQWGYTMRIVDIWTERGVRWNGDAPETSAAFRYMGDTLWLMRQHCEGQWVTWRKPLPEDFTSARAAWNRIGLTPPERIAEEGDSR